MQTEGRKVKHRTQEGTVVSERMQKTRVIEVKRTWKHPKYLKYFERSIRVKAHDENNEYKLGDKVVIEETRPLSREKRWKIVGRVK